MKKYFYLLIIALSILVFAFSVYSLFNLPVESRMLEVGFIAGPITGFDVNGTALKFGEIMPGSSSSRTIILHNSHGFPINVRFFPSDNLESLMNFNKSLQRIEINETKMIPVILTVPKGYEFGNYEGNFTALIYKAGS